MVAIKLPTRAITEIHVAIVNAADADSIANVSSRRAALIATPTPIFISSVLFDIFLNSSINLCTVYSSQDGVQLSAIDHLHYVVIISANTKKANYKQMVAISIHPTGYCFALPLAHFLKVNF